MQHSKPVSKKELASLFGQKSLGKAYSAILINWLVFLGFAILSGKIFGILAFPFSAIAYVVLSFIVGCALRGFDNLTHEASHNNIFPRPKLHLSLQFLFAYPVMKEILDYRAPHMKHHSNYRDNKEDDPDTKQNIRWGVEYLAGKSGAVLLFRLYFLRLLTLYYVIDNIRFNFIPYIISRNNRGMRLVFWIIMLTAVQATNNQVMFLLGYFIPYLFWLPYIRFITESSKHSNVNLQDDFSNSRSNIGWIHQLLLHPHNDGFHQMHHFMASIPFYNLKKAYRYIRDIPEVKEQVIESHSPIETVKQMYK